jgi:GNAT superfamily N-acetyltransferase
MIRRCNDSEFETVWEIINAGARAYAGVIPEDRYEEPYMSCEKLRHEMEAGVVFWGCDNEDGLAGVMGIQYVGDVTLIRHAYVRPSAQKQGIGGKLLSFLREQTSRPVLIGTWGDAYWAVRFYEKHGFRLVSPEEKVFLLHRYWSIPERQVETSVVLADEGYFGGSD